MAISKPAFKLGVVILAHRLPEQLAVLLGALRHPQVAIYLHLDERTAIEPFQAQLADAGVDDVRWLPRRRTVWGGPQIVNADIDGFTQALAEGCSYTILISGQDFPLRPIAEIVDFFEANRARSYIQAWPLPLEHWELGGRDRTDFYSYDFLGTRYTCVPSGEDLCWMIPRRRAFNLLLRARTSFSPPRRFPSYLRAYGGSHWVNLSREASEYLLAFIAEHPDYARYHRHTMCADELFVQSVLAGTEFSDTHEIVNDDLRFMIWEEHVPAHPKTLTLEDVPMMLRGDALFARKFDLRTQPVLLAELRQQVGAAGDRAEQLGRPAASI